MIMPRVKCLILRFVYAKYQVKYLHIRIVVATFTYRVYNIGRYVATSVKTMYYQYVELHFILYHIDKAKFDCGIVFYHIVNE